MDSIFPSRVEAAAADHGIPPALAFGLGEGLNLYYSRRAGERPPHRITILPPDFDTRLAARVAVPRDEAIAAALAGGGYAVMVCHGDWRGIDGIETWSEDLSRWPLLDGWRESIDAAAALIEKSDGLYRRAYARFLDLARPTYPELGVPRALLDPLADAWLDLAVALRGARADASRLDRLGTRLRRVAAQESRFWGMILDRFGDGI